MRKQRWLSFLLALSLLPNLTTPAAALKIGDIIYDETGCLWLRYKRSTGYAVTAPPEG